MCGFDHAPLIEPAATQRGEELLSADDVASTLRCSARHVRRLTASGRIPDPVMLGGLRRWRRHDIDSWIILGCPTRDEFVDRMRSGETGR